MTTQNGAPGSLERFKAEHPLDWWRMLGSGEGCEILDRYICGSSPTHHLPVWEGMTPISDPPSRYDTAWELGEIVFNGETEYHYGTRVYRQGVRTLDTFWDRKPLPPIRYSQGEYPGTGPL